MTTTLTMIERTYLNTPKADRKRIEKARETAIGEIVARHLPGVTLRYWAPKDAPRFNIVAPAISRVYLCRDGEKLGFAGVRRSRRRAEGRYEQHRSTKGEDHYETTFESDLPEDVLAALRAAVMEYLTRIDELQRADDADQFEYSFGALAL